MIHEVGRVLIKQRRRRGPHDPAAVCVMEPAVAAHGCWVNDVMVTNSAAQCRRPSLQPYGFV